MPRNFDRRVEVMLPIDDEQIRRRIIDEILGIEQLDNTKASVLQPNGTYKRVKPGRGKRIRAQSEFMHLAQKRAIQKKTGKRPKTEKRQKIPRRDSGRRKH